MKNTILKYSFITLSALFISSCSSDDSSLDTTKPEINLLSPKDEDHFHLGDDINIEAILKDNVELGAVKIDLHYGGDGHTHNHRSAKAVETLSSAEIPWEFSKEEAIPSGKKEYAFNYKISIPEEGITDGPYHLGLILIDKAGNQSETYIEIDVVDHSHEH
ncbi:DUF4625 domain-containing protein [Empedobacter brevis]|uniref:DUF4625 domain-containing protein n=1 Tax=Empedobacter brevis TaxID=247 RepID=UPI0039B10E6C